MTPKNSELSTDPTRSNFKENRKRKRQIYKNEEEMLAFGYESKIYKDKDLAIRIEQGKYLIPWKSLSSSKIMMDRYDVRHLIQEQKLFRVTEKSTLDIKYNKERYAELMRDEDDASQNGSIINSSRAAIPYDYNKAEKKEKTDAVRNISDFEREIREKYRTPDTMIVPTSRNQMALIETVSKEIGLAANPNLLEIRIQVKNANNSLYSFLNKQDPLFQFYKYLVSKINFESAKKSLVAYSDSSSDESDEEKDDKIPAELKIIIQKTASSIANSRNSDQLEEHLRLKKGHELKFSFLNKDSIYFSYFKSQIKQNQLNDI